MLAGAPGLGSVSRTGSSVADNVAPFLNLITVFIYGCSGSLLLCVGFL